MRYIHEYEITWFISLLTQQNDTLMWTHQICDSLNVVDPHKLRSGSIWRCDLPCLRKDDFGGGWMAHTFNPDHEAIGHIFNLVHILCYRCAIWGWILRFFFSQVSLSVRDGWHSVASKSRCRILSCSTIVVWLALCLLSLIINGLNLRKCRLATLN